MVDRLAATSSAWGIHLAGGTSARAALLRRRRTRALLVTTRDLEASDPSELAAQLAVLVTSSPANRIIVGAVEWRECAAVGEIPRVPPPLAARLAVRELRRLLPRPAGGWWTSHNILPSSGEQSLRVGLCGIQPTTVPGTFSLLATSLLGGRQAGTRAEAVPLAVALWNLVKVTGRGLPGEIVIWSEGARAIALDFRGDPPRLGIFDESAGPTARSLDTFLREGPNPAPLTLWVVGNEEALARARLQGQAFRPSPQVRPLDLEEALAARSPGEEHGDAGGGERSAGEAMRGSPSALALGLALSGLGLGGWDGAVGPPPHIPSWRARGPAVALGGGGILLALLLAMQLDMTRGGNRRAHPTPVSSASSAPALAPRHAAPGEPPPPRSSPPVPERVLGPAPPPSQDPATAPGRCILERDALRRALAALRSLDASGGLPSLAGLDLSPRQAGAWELSLLPSIPSNRDTLLRETRALGAIVETEASPGGAVVLLFRPNPGAAAVARALPEKSLFPMIRAAASHPPPSATVPAPPLSPPSLSPETAEIGGETPGRFGEREAIEERLTGSLPEVYQELGSRLRARLDPSGAAGRWIWPRLLLLRIRGLESEESEAGVGVEALVRYERWILDLSRL